MGKRKETGGLAGNVMLQVNGAKEAFACEQCRCDVCMPVTLCEQAEDGVWLCRECADKEHREREAAEYSGPVHEAEGWK
jgi:hypothetical protein